MRLSWGSWLLDGVVYSWELRVDNGCETLRFFHAGVEVTNYGQYLSCRDYYFGSIGVDYSSPFALC